MKHYSWIIYLLIAFGIAQLLVSCQVMYMPNKQNVPLFKAPNEIQIAIGPFDFQTAYSINKHLGVVVNGQFQSFWGTEKGLKDTATSESSRSITRMVEVGAGYYTILRDGLNFQAFGGFGYGKNRVEVDIQDQHSSQIFDSYSIRANTTHFFIQPAVGFTTKPVDFALSCRVVFLNYFNFENRNYPLDQLYANAFWEMDKNSYCFIEPALTMRFGTKNAKFHLQYIYSGLIGGAVLSYLPFRINFGLHVNLFVPNKK